MKMKKKAAKKKDSRNKRSSAWKDLEKKIAKDLNGIRNERGANFAVADSDVDIPPDRLFAHTYDNPRGVIVECKHRGGKKQRGVIKNFQQKTVHVKDRKTVLIWGTPGKHADRTQSMVTDSRVMMCWLEDFPFFWQTLFVDKFGRRTFLEEAIVMHTDNIVHNYIHDWLREGGSYVPQKMQAWYSDGGSSEKPPFVLAALREKASPKVLIIWYLAAITGRPCGFDYCAGSPIFP